MTTKKIKRELVLKWYEKYSYLHKFINNLEQKMEIGSSITSFMLNSQLIEYRLKKEINLLSHYINSNITDTRLKLVSKSVEEIEEEKMTLGNLIKELDYYEGKQLINLKKILKELVHYRNLFIHRLFNIGTLEEIEKAALKGNQLANKAWNEMDEINYFTGGDYSRDISA